METVLFLVLIAVSIAALLAIAIGMMALAMLAVAEIITIIRNLWRGN